MGEAPLDRSVRIIFQKRNRAAGHPLGDIPRLQQLDTFVPFVPQSEAEGPQGEASEPETSSQAAENMEPENEPGPAETGAV
jgi:hypothetical protein